MKLMEALPILSQQNIKVKEYEDVFKPGDLFVLSDDRARLLAGANSDNTTYAKVAAHVLLVPAEWEDEADDLIGLYIHAKARNIPIDINGIIKKEPVVEVDSEATPKPKKNSKKSK